MFAKPLSAFALLAMSAHFVSATPPACMLGAVNTEPNPANMAQICGAHAAKVQAQIHNLCGPETATAMKAFSSICKAAGFQVAAPSKSSSSKTEPHSSHTTVKKTESHSSHTSSHAKIHKSTKTTSIHVTHSTSTVRAGKTPPTAIRTDSAPKTTTHVSSTMHSPTASSQPDNVAGRIDAQGFASLALMAAGLAVFL